MPVESCLAEGKITALLGTVERVRWCEDQEPVMRGNGRSDLISVNDDVGAKMPVYERATRTYDVQYATSLSVRTSDGHLRAPPSLSPLNAVRVTCRADKKQNIKAAEA